ncbi:MAG: T9SS type A sorting domain-containing protein [bacterium]
MNQVAVQDSLLFAATDAHRVIETIDFGRSWIELSNGLQDVDFQSIDLLGSQVIAGATDAIYSSDSYGVQWKRLPITAFGKTSVVMYDSIFRVSIWGTGVFTSTRPWEYWFQDSGYWDLRNLSSTSTDVFATDDKGNVLRCSRNSTKWHITAMQGLQTTALVTNGDSIYVGTAQGTIYISKDRGLQWTQIVSILPKEAITSISVIGSDIYVVMTTQLFRSSDRGKSWTLISNDIYSATLVVSSSTKLTNRMFIGTNHGVFYSDDEGEHWITTSLTVGGVYALASGGDSIYAGTENGAFVSGDHGNSWKLIDTNKHQKTTTFYLNDSVLLVGTVDGIDRYDRENNNWRYLDHSFKAETVTSISRSNGIYYAAVIDLVGFSQVFTIKTSKDEGASWQNNFSPTYAVSHLFDYLSKICGTYSSCYNNFGTNANCAGGTLISRDFGNKWSTSQVPGAGNCAAIGDNMLWVGSDIGIFQCSATTFDWQKQDSELPDLSVQNIFFSPHYMFAGTYKHSIWRRPLSQLSVLPENADELVLGNIFPNPTSSEIEVSFVLPKAQLILLQAFDLAGTLVGTCTDAYYEKGKHSIKWDCKNLEAGSYYIRLLTNSAKCTKKFILRK